MAVPADATRGTVLAELFDAFVEENLVQPTFIYDYPVENSPLAKRKPTTPAFTERFEYFICGCEYGKRLLRAQRPHRPEARFVAQVEKKRAENPNTTAQVGRGLRHRPWSTECRPPAAWASAWIASSCC